MNENPKDYGVYLLNRKMKVIKSRATFELIECKKCDGWNYKEINSIDEDLFSDYKVAIVYDEDEEQYYVVDRLTHLILSTHLSVNNCIDWLYRTGFDLIELKRKYDKVRYKEEIKTWNELERSESKHGKEKDLN